MLAGETDNCDHSVIWVTQAIIGHTVTHHAHLFPLGDCGKHQDSDVSISGGKLIAVNIDEIDWIGRSV